MNDKELLELAAKAAGYTIDDEGTLFNRFYWFWCRELESYWEPLIDDGDALRLAVKLNIDVWYSDDLCIVGTTFMYGNDGYNTEENWAELDKMAATRRAIVRAAAEIGKAK